MKRKILVTILLSISMSLKGCGAPPSASASVTTFASNVVTHTHNTSKGIKNNFNTASNNINYLANPESKRKYIKQIQKIIDKAKAQDLALAF